MAYRGVSYSFTYGYLRGCPMFHRSTINLIARLGAPDLPLSFFQALLIIAERHPKGITVDALRGLAHLSKAGGVRVLQRLGAGSRSKAHGTGKPLGLITTMYDPVETRRFLAILTRKGAKVLGKDYG